MASARGHLGAKPARPRLVHLLPCRRADRIGPFVAVYLTTQKWTQSEIGLILSIGGIIGLIGQMPGGVVIDAARSERLVAGLAVATIGLSALAYAAWPIFPVIALAAILHAAASCVLGPAIAAISLGLVGPEAIGERLWTQRALRIAWQWRGCGGDGCRRIPAIEPRRVRGEFRVCDRDAAFAGANRDREIDPEQAHGAIARAKPDPDATSIVHLLHQRPLVVFACVVFLLQFANAAMLPLTAGIVTARSSQGAPMLIALCIIVPQAIVALISPSVGRKAQVWDAARCS